MPGGSGTSGGDGGATPGGIVFAASSFTPTPATPEPVTPTPSGEAVAGFAIGRSRTVQAVTTDAPGAAATTPFTPTAAGGPAAISLPPTQPSPALITPAAPAAAAASPLPLPSAVATPATTPTPAPPTSAISPPPVPIDFGKKKKKKKRPKPMTPNEFQYRYKRTGIVLGEGSFAVVEECVGLAVGRCVNGWMREIGKAYAVKVIEKSDSATMEEREKNREQVMRETELLMMSRNHPHILQLLDQYETEFDHKLVFEKVAGGELFAHIQERRTFTEHEASLVTQNLASAVSFLHSKGIVHRDLKPQNILCVSKESASPCKICDFNLGYSSQSAVSSSADTDARDCMSPTLNVPVGTPEYMSPEVVATMYGMGEEVYDKRCDIWSLGVILYIMLSGQPPFAGDCGYDCGWKDNEACDQCQDLLEDEISDGFIEIEAEPWNRISGAAKDLVCRMLVPESKRLSADQIMEHPWIKQDAPPTPLDTPMVLRRTSTLELLEAHVDDANAKNRLIDVPQAPRGGGGGDPHARNAAARQRSHRTSAASSDGSDIVPFFAPSPLAQSGQSASDLSARHRGHGHLREPPRSTSDAIRIPRKLSITAKFDSMEGLSSFKMVRSMSLDNIVTPELQRRRAGSPRKEPYGGAIHEHIGSFGSSGGSVGSAGSGSGGRSSSFGSPLTSPENRMPIPAFLKRRLSREHSQAAGV